MIPNVRWGAEISLSGYSSSSGDDVRYVPGLATAVADRLVERGEYATIDVQHCRDYLSAVVTVEATTHEAAEQTCRAALSAAFDEAVAALRSDSPDFAWSMGVANVQAIA